VRHGTRKPRWTAGGVVGILRGAAASSGRRSSIPIEKAEGNERQVSSAPAAVLAVALTFVAAVAPAAGRTSGRESIRGTIVASGESGTRTLLSSVFVATGAFTGTGHDVEVANRPGDPQNVTRDDLVFPAGKIHIRVTSQPPTMSANPQTESDGFAWPQRDGLKWPHLALVVVVLRMLPDGARGSRSGSCGAVARRAAAERDPDRARSSRPVVRSCV
jgi:hypothetical protein